MVDRPRRSVDERQDLRSDPVETVGEVGAHRLPAVDLHMVVHPGVSARGRDLLHDRGQRHIAGTAGDRFLPVGVFLQLLKPARVLFEHPVVSSRVR